VPKTAYLQWKTNLPRVLEYLSTTRVVNYSSNFWETVCKTVRPMLSVRCLSCRPVCLSVCDVGVLWQIKMKLGMQVGLGLFTN